MYRIYITKGAKDDRFTETISSDPQPLEMAMDSVRELISEYLTVKAEKPEAWILADEPEISIMYEPE